MHLTHISCLLLALVLFNSSPVGGQTLGTHPFTESWYFLKDKSLPEREDYLAYRKYIVIISRNIDGSSNISGFRNNVIFYCSLNKKNLTYINFIMPREINIHSILGKEYMDGYEVDIFADEKRFTVPSEIHNNEVFIDLTPSQESAFYEILSARNLVVAIDDVNSISFKMMGKFDPPMLGADSFDALVFNSLVEQIEEVQQLKYEQVIQTCSALGGNVTLR